MADLKVIITEQLTLNGKEQGGSFQKTITGITDVYKRIVTVPADVDTTLVSFKSSAEPSNMMSVILKPNIVLAFSNSSCAKGEFS